MLKLLKPALSAFLLVLFVLMLPCSCAKTRGNPAVPAKTLSAAVSFDALFELASSIGGERVSVTAIIPDGSEPHSFEPKAKDLELLNTADILILNGFGLEPWSDDAVAAANNKNLRVTIASDGVEPIELSGSHDAHDKSHDHEAFDPHVWLSLISARIIAENITACFSEADPDGADYYMKNCLALTSSLDSLFNEYSAKFSELDRKTIVTGHAVFAYLCRDFGLTQNSVEGVFAEGEPSARRLAELVEYCRENNVTTVLAERGTSTNVSETLAREANAAVAAVYTCESAEEGLSYLERMERNLAVIYNSLNS